MIKDIIKITSVCIMMSGSLVGAMESNEAARSKAIEQLRNKEVTIDDVIKKAENGENGLSFHDLKKILKMEDFKLSTSQAISRLKNMEVISSNSNNIERRWILRSLCPSAGDLHNIVQKLKADEIEDSFSKEGIKWIVSTDGKWLFKDLQLRYGSDVVIDKLVGFHAWENRHQADDKLQKGVNKGVTCTYYFSGQNDDDEIVKGDLTLTTDGVLGD